MRAGPGWMAAAAGSWPVTRVGDACTGPFLLPVTATTAPLLTPILRPGSISDTGTRGQPRSCVCRASVEIGFVQALKVNNDLKN